MQAEHLTSELLQSELRAVVRANRLRVAGLPVVLASADDEQHHLPLLALEAELARNGVASLFLGPRVPADALVSALRESRPRAVFLWASLPRPRDEPFWRELEVVDWPLEVVIGGPGLGRRASSAPEGPVVADAGRRLRLRRARARPEPGGSRADRRWSKKSQLPERGCKILQSRSGAVSDMGARFSPVVERPDAGVSDPAHKGVRMRRRPALSVASISALVMAGLAVPLAGAPTARADAPRTATLVGSLQDELGCSGDWQPDCTKTDLALEPGTTTYAAEFRVPAGSYELKVAINHSWGESYGQGSGNVPLVLAGPATLRFTYDDTTHAVGVAPTDLPGAATKADSKLAASSLRSLATKERFYFVMADRFANGDTRQRQGRPDGRPPRDRLRPDERGLLPRW